MAFFNIQLEVKYVRDKIFKKQTNTGLKIGNLFDGEGIPLVALLWNYFHMGK